MTQSRYNIHAHLQYINFQPTYKFDTEKQLLNTGNQFFLWKEIKIQTTINEMLWWAQIDRTINVEPWTVEASTDTKFMLDR